jgi:hypothetical protein
LIIESMFPALTAKKRRGGRRRATRRRSPVGLRQDRDAEAARLEHAAEDRHREARVVDVGVARDEHDVRPRSMPRAATSAAVIGRKASRSLRGRDIDRP